MDRGVYIDRSEAERTTLLEAIERYEKETIARKGLKLDLIQIERAPYLY